MGSAPVCRARKLHRFPQRWAHLLIRSLPQPSAPPVGDLPLLPPLLLRPLPRRFRSSRSLWVCCGALSSYLALVFLFLLISERPNYSMKLKGPLQNPAYARTVLRRSRRRQSIVHIRVWSVLLRRCCRPSLHPNRHTATRLRCSLASRQSGFHSRCARRRPRAARLRCIRSISLQCGSSARTF